MITEWEKSLLKSVMPINEDDSGLSQAQIMCDELTDSFYKYFPKSYCKFTFMDSRGSSTGSSIYGQFTLGKDKSEYSSGYADNDPMYSKMFIYGWTADGEPYDGNIETRMILGGGFMIKARNPSFAYETIKVWRKFPKTDPQRTMKKMDEYFKKLHDTMEHYKDEIDTERSGYDISDKL